MEFRYARHTNRLDEVTKFYKQLLSLSVLFKFENHEGYNGVIIGKPGVNWQLEFTSSDDKANQEFDEDDVLVFYPSEKEEYEAILKRIEEQDLSKLQSRNPYWNDNGIQVKDPDGYNVIVSNLRVQ